MEQTAILDAPTMTKDVLNQDQQELQPPLREEVTHDEPITTKEALNEGQQEAQSLYKGEVNEQITTEEVLIKGQQEEQPSYSEEVTLHKPTTVRGLSNESQQQVGPLYWKTKLHRFRKYCVLRKSVTIDEILNLGEQEILNPGEQEIQPVYRESKRPIRKRQRRRREVRLRDREEVQLNEVPTTKEVLNQGRQEDRLLYSEEEMRKTSENFTPPDEPGRESSIPQKVDRRGELKLDILCQRLFKAAFRDIHRSGQF